MCMCSLVIATVCSCVKPKDIYKAPNYLGNSARNCACRSKVTISFEITSNALNRQNKGEVGCTLS